MPDPMPGFIPDSSAPSAPNAARLLPANVGPLVVLTSRRTWIAQLSLLGLVIGVLLWSVFGTVLLTMSGQGIIVRRGGTSMVLAHADGVVTGLRPLKVGDRVARGEVLGEIIPLSTKRQMVQLGRAPTEPTAPTAPTAPMASEGALLSLQDGLVVETLVNNADVVKAGQALLSLEPVERQLEAVIYLPANGMAKALRPGMQVQLSPAHTRRESVGYLQGEISEIAKYPSTDTAMMSLFGNAQLVREFSAAGAPQAVTVVLKIDPDSASGYQWSTAAGARVALSSGTLVQARFVLDASSPIAVGLRRARL